MGDLIMAIPHSRVDERDTMFARAALVPGTTTYEAQYGRRPDLKDVDDTLRSLPRLLEPGSTFFNPEVMAEAEQHFMAIEALHVEDDWLAQHRDGLAQSPDPSGYLKNLALELGAVAAGWAPLEPAFIYSHKGRFPEEHGKRVELDHPNVLVFLVEMDRNEMRKAPKAPTLRESARQYFRAARVSLHLEALLRASGHQAKQHYDAHYDIILPPLAVLAGLGEMGRNNILLADRFGGRVRIGAVSTSFQPRHDAPRSLGAAHFCSVCKKCADNCPGRALRTGDQEACLGVMKWPTEVEKCYRYWRQVGTDCGICMASCPFSHEDNLLHNTVRWMVRHAPWTHRMLVWGDDLFYGRKWRSRG